VTWGLQHLYRDPVFLALLPPVALTFDYSMTFRLAGSHEAVLASEASPVVRLVLANHFMVAYFLALLSLYFLASLATLRLLRGTRYYQFGVVCVFIVSTAHGLGGLSWVARSASFSVATSLLVTFLFLLTALWIGRNLIAEWQGPAGVS